MASAYPIAYMIVVLFIFIILFVFSVLAIINLLKSNTQNADISAAKSVLVGITIFQLVSLFIFMAMLYFYSTAKDKTSVYKYINIWYIIIFIYASLFLFIAYKLNCYRKESQVNYNAWRWSSLSAALCFIGLIVIMSIKIFESKERLGCVKEKEEIKELKTKLESAEKEKTKVERDLFTSKSKEQTCSDDIKKCRRENKELSEQATCFSCQPTRGKGQPFTIGSCNAPPLVQRYEPTQHPFAPKKIRSKLGRESS